MVNRNKNKIFFFILATLILIGIYLSLFELLLYSFHSPLNSCIETPFLHQKTWTYLLEQKYISFIGLDIFSIHEKRHLLDVKRVFEQTYNLWLLFMSLTTFIVLILTIKFKFKSKFNVLLKYIYTLGFVLNTLLLLFMFSFLNSFKFIHTLFFSSNTWYFSQNSLLIKWFPLQYFQEFVTFFLLLSFLTFLLLFFIKTYATIPHEYFNNR
jgi:hypothetical protein